MWRIAVEKRARKATERIPAKDAERVALAIDRLGIDPYAGDVRKLGPGSYRLRVGSYRVFFSIDPAARIVTVIDLVRRSSTTY